MAWVVMALPVAAGMSGGRELAGPAAVARCYGRMRSSAHSSGRGSAPGEAQHHLAAGTGLVGERLFRDLCSRCGAQTRLLMLAESMRQVAEASAPRGQVAIVVSGVARRHPLAVVRPWTKKSASCAGAS